VQSPTSAALHALWGSGRADVWAAGDGGTLLHHDGTGWQQVALAQPTSQRFLALWGSGPADVWAVGTRGVLRHWDGARWEARPPFTTEDLVAVWGAGPAELYVLEQGSSARLFRHDGRTWTPHAVPFGGQLRGVFGTPGAVRVAGSAGALLRFRP
jgi:hypothetical protein